MQESRPVQSAIESKLTTTFQPVLLDVVNESHMHSVPPGCLRAQQFYPVRVVGRP